MSHKAWNFILCQSLQVWSILESHFYSNQNVRSQPPTSQPKKPESPWHILLLREHRPEALKKNHRDANPNLPKCKISTNHIYNTNCGVFFCKLNPVLKNKYFQKNMKIFKTCMYRSCKLRNSCNCYFFPICHGFLKP